MTDQVERYNLIPNYNGLGSYDGIEKTEDGSFIDHRDYAAQARRIAELEAALARQIDLRNHQCELKLSAIDRAKTARAGALREAAEACLGHRYADSFLNTCNLRKVHREDISKHILALIDTPAAIAAAVQAEREACADLAAKRYTEWNNDSGVCCDATACEEIAAAIRARSEGET